MAGSQGNTESARTLGQMLQRGREAVGLAIRQLADEIGVDRGYLSRLERDFYKRPNLQILNRLATRLDLDYTELVASTGQAAPEQAPSFPRYIVSRYNVTEEQAVVLGMQWQKILDEYDIHERPHRQDFDLPH
jgi:transcriptional regulator with XRE-family HTH domain